VKKAQPIERETFKRLLQEKRIRPASLDDVWGTHHDRPIYEHPNTGAPYVEIEL
jgi:hypothetical protein